jgi:hypothetical protein
MSSFASTRLVPSLLAARAAVAWRPAFALAGSAVPRAPATCLLIRRPCSSSGFQKIAMPAIMVCYWTVRCFCLVCCFL